MAKLAIIIGVSNYVRYQPLSACTNDAELIRTILVSSNEYEDILYLGGADTTSDIAKTQLTQFIDKHKGRTDLSEIFVFYSGHGDYWEDEFYYLFSDFDETRRNRTSLKNSELDGFIRTLCPELTVKVVDACNAGVQYVKDISGLETIITKGTTEQGLKKVYFLFSSLLDQSSFASASVSHFTQSFVKSIIEYRPPEIRYRDIIDYIADDFSNNQLQKPFFVIQADNTELFGHFSEEDKNHIKSKYDQVTNESSNQSSQDPTKNPTIASLIKEQAKDYLSDEEILNALEGLRDTISNFSFPEDIRELYDIQFRSSKDFTGLQGVAEIGKWLQENKKEFFGRVVTRVVDSDSHTDYEQFKRVFEILNTASSNQITTKIKSVITGYEISWDSPTFWRLAITLNSQYPNIPTIQLNILYLFSRLDIRLFYSVDEIWPGPGDVAKRTIFGAWKATQFKLRQLKEQPYKSVEPIKQDLISTVLERLRQIAGIQKEVAEDLENTTE